MAGNVNTQRDPQTEYVDPRQLAEQGSLLQAWEGGNEYGHRSRVELYEVGVNEERNYVARYLEGQAADEESGFAHEVYVHDAGNDVNVASRFADYDVQGWETEGYPDIRHEHMSWPAFARIDQDSTLGPAARHVPAALEWGRMLEVARDQLQESVQKPQYLGDSDLTAVEHPGMEITSHDGWESYDPDRFQLHKNTPLLVKNLFDDA